MVKKRCKFALQCGDACNKCEICGTPQFIINTECYVCNICVRDGPNKSRRPKVI